MGTSSFMQIHHVLLIYLNRYFEKSETMLNGIVKSNGIVFHDNNSFLLQMCMHFNAGVKFMITLLGLNMRTFNHYVTSVLIL